MNIFMENQDYIYVPLYIQNIVFTLFTNWGQAVDLRVDIEPLLNMSINDLKLEMKTPKFLRTIRSNKAPIILRFGIWDESRTI